MKCIGVFLHAYSDNQGQTQYSKKSSNTLKVELGKWTILQNMNDIPKFKFDHIKPDAIDNKIQIDNQTA